MRHKANTPKGALPFLTFAAVLFFPGCQEGFIEPPLTDGPISRPTYDLVVEPTNLVLEQGEAIQFEAYWKNTDTGTLHHAESIHWESDPPRHVFISEDGLAEARRRGEVTITAVSLESDDQNPFRGREATAIVLVQ